MWSLKAPHDITFPSTFCGKKKKKNIGITSKHQPSIYFCIAGIKQQRGNQLLQSIPTRLLTTFVNGMTHCMLQLNKSMANVTVNKELPLFCPIKSKPQDLKYHLFYLIFITHCSCISMAILSKLCIFKNFVFKVLSHIDDPRILAKKMSATAENKKKYL